MVLQLPQYTGHLLTCHDLRDSAFSARPHDALKLTYVSLKYMPKEKNEGV
jgi:hypothetical protein